jgi:ribonucleoside-diphosphate reductase beta chain
MIYSTFNESTFDATKEPMFLGKNVNVARYDKQKYPAFEKLIQKQLSFFWRPEEIDLTKDRKDFIGMAEHERHIFLSNLKYQTLLDSVQGRSPSVAFLPIVSLPELETWFETWSFSETIHSRSYTHIIRNIISDPSIVFDDIVANENIKERAFSVTENYDRLIEKSFIYNVDGYINRTVFDQVKNESYQVKVSEDTLMDDVYMALISVYALEAIRFYVSFACTFAFGERAIMEGNAKIIKLIARDEALHKYGTQMILGYIANGQEGPKWKAVAHRNRDKAIALFKAAIHQEKEWASYLFKDGSMIGLNGQILSKYVDYISNKALTSIGFGSEFESENDPLPWMKSWLVSDNVQVAPQESEISSYLVGQVDSSIGEEDFDDIDL